MRWEEGASPPARTSFSTSEPQGCRGRQGSCATVPAWPEREKDVPRSLGREGPRHPRLDLRARPVTPKPGQHPRGEETLDWAGGVGTSQGQGDRTPEALVPHTHTRVCTAHGTEPDFPQKDSQRSELCCLAPHPAGCTSTPSKYREVPEAGAVWPREGSPRPSGPNSPEPWDGRGESCSHLPGRGLASSWGPGHASVQPPTDRLLSRWGHRALGARTGLGHIPACPPSPGGGLCRDRGAWGQGPARGLNLRPLLHLHPPPPYLTHVVSGERSLRN